MPKLVETISDLEDLCEETECTVQITCRARRTPRWLVRIQRRGGHDLIYRQAVDDDLSEALEMCYEAWLLDKEAEKAGRNKDTDVDRD